MTQKQKYNLVFQKIIDSEYGISYTCNTTIPNNIGLTVIEDMSVNEIIGFISNIDDALTSQQYNQFPYSDGYASTNFEINPPNITIDDDSYPLNDFKELLKEWLDYIS